VIALLALLMLVFAFSCGDGTDDAETEKMMVDAEGGSFIGPDGMQLLVPAGAIDREIEFEIIETQPPGIVDITQVSRFYKISPVETVFTKNFTVKIPYNKNSVPEGSKETEIRVATNGSGQWEFLDDEPDVAETWAIGKSKMFGTFGAMVGDGDDPVVYQPQILTTDQVDFGLVAISDSYTDTLTIENKGEADLVISAISLDDDTVFSFKAINMPATIAAGETIDLEVIFAPLAQTDYEALLEIASNDPTIPIWEIGLHGIGASTGIAQASAAINFGYVAINEEMTQSATITNSSTTGKLRILSISLSNGVGFDLTQPENLLIEQESEIEIQVTFSPTASQEYSSELIIKVDDINNSDLEVPLTGTSLVSDGDNEDDLDGDLDSEDEVSESADGDIDEADASEAETEE